MNVFLNIMRTTIYFSKAVSAVAMVIILAYRMRSFIKDQRDEFGNRY